MVFLLSCRTMLVLLTKPPRSFEGFVHEHFCTRANFILQAFKANTDCSAAFGHYQDNVSHFFFEGSVKLHQKTKLYLELETAFTKNTASVTKLAFTDDTKNEALVLHTSNNEGLYQSKQIWGLIGLVLGIVCLPLLFSVFLELVG